LRKKITYGLLTILLIGGLYLGLRFAFGLFTPLNSWTARQDIKNGKIQIVVLGEILPTDQQRQSFAKANGFDFYYFGDNISTDIINGTKYYNQTMVDYLEKKYGSGWWTKFQTQLDSIDKTNTTPIFNTNDKLN
jgi:dipeptide/tripeptide permease